MADNPAADPPLGGSPARAHQDADKAAITNSSRTVSPDTPTKSAPVPIPSSRTVSPDTPAKSAPAPTPSSRTASPDTPTKSAPAPTPSTPTKSRSNSEHNTLLDRSEDKETKQEAGPAQSNYRSPSVYTDSSSSTASLDTPTKPALARNKSTPAQRPSNSKHTFPLDSSKDRRTKQEVPAPLNYLPASRPTDLSSFTNEPITPSRAEVIVNRFQGLLKVRPTESPTTTKAFDQRKQHDDLVSARSPSNRRPKPPPGTNTTQRKPAAEYTMSSSNQPSGPANTDAFANIRALNELKAEVPLALKSAGLAVNALTDRPLQPSSADEADIAAHSAEMEARKANFQAHTADFYARIKTLSEGLNKSLQGLVEAGIVKDTVEGQGDEEKGVSNGGLGELDVGNLNARAKDVGTGKAAEMLKEMRARLEKMKREREEAKRKRDEEEGKGGEEDGDKMLGLE
ncbi:hypothetical protein K490DRAFT_68640 [Saccharata proteae CBS 121410]|uniref:Mediator of RNA polymerase II transcription subunit 11 n=1 Tax=Saccharata proteae CBS 121410 TaxID=1314787 RepID=A0A9P4HQF1_9PEZI|nr:hypothetical protein K490DRAFT_68640 [Saccharata proteae CBS 121410]